MLSESRKLYKAAWEKKDREKNPEKYAAKAKGYRVLYRQHIHEYNKAWMKRQHPLYVVWRKAKQRCKDPNDPKFSRYGGRGIIMCEKWLSSFEVFKAWGLANGWKAGLQIDRIDNDGNYEPGNCRFVPLRENVWNRGSNKLTLQDAVEIRRLRAGGELQKAIAEKYGVTREMVSCICLGKSWSEEIAA